MLWSWSTTIMGSSATNTVCSHFFNIIVKGHSFSQVYSRLCVCVTGFQPHCLPILMPSPAFPRLVNDSFSLHAVTYGQQWGVLLGAPVGSVSSAWGHLLEVEPHDADGHLDNLLGVDPSGSFAGMLGVWGLWCSGFTQSILGELESPLRGCLESGTPTLGSPAGIKELGQPGLRVPLLPSSKC